MVLARHVMSQDRKILNGLWNFIGSNPSRWATILSSLLATGTLEVEKQWSSSATWLCKTTRSGCCRLTVLEPFKISHHPTKFHGHRHCGSGDVMALSYHVMSQDHVIRESCDFMGSNSSRWAIILLSLVVIATLVVKL